MSKQKRMTKAIPLLVMSLFVLLFPITGSAQSSSAVTGVVTDTTGAIVAGATVTLTDTKTSKELTTTTDDQGVYRFTQVAPGQGYKLTFTSPGFQTYIINDVALGVGITETHNAQLPVGTVSGSVEVTASNEATLNTTDASVGNVIETRRLAELPVQIRSSPAALIGLQPGVVGNNVGTAAGNRVGSVTGSRADQGNITVDGIDANDQATGQFAATVGNAPIDSIQEFRAVTANPSAAEGRSSGGQVELVTKGGTNDFHGTVYEYNRTAKTAANSFFNNRRGNKADGTPVAPRPQLTRNQYGGSIGGPIMKDKLFFFFNYEARRDAQGVSYTRIVPLASFRNGGLSYIRGGNDNAGTPCSFTARNTSHPECIVTLTPAQVAALDPQHIGANAALLSFINSRYPLPNDLTGGDGINTGAFVFNAPSHRKDNTYVTRIDYNATSKQKIFGRFNIARRIQTDTVNSVAEQFPGDPETAQIQVKDYSYVIGHTWVASSSIVNQATFGVSRSGLLFPTLFKPSFPNALTFGAGLTAPFAGFSDQDRFVLVPTIRDDLTWIKGSHNLAFGGVLKPIDSKSGLTNDFNFVTIGLGGNTSALSASLRPANIRGGSTAPANFDSAFAFLLGRIGNVSTTFNYDKDGKAFAPGTGKKRDFKYNEYEVYFQDNWKVRPDLTLTYGLRYQYYSPPYEKNGFQACQDVDFRRLFDLRQQNAARGIAGDNAEPFLRYDLCGKANNAHGFYEPDLNNLAPRLSFAYNPSFKNGFMGKIFGDHKTVIRGGGTVVYDRVGGAITFIQDQVSYLFDNSATTAFGGLTPTAALLNNPRFTSIASPGVVNAAPVITRPFTPFVDGTTPTGLATGEFNYAIDQQFRTPYAIQYSFGFQREMPGNFILEASYVGRQARKLFTQADAAQTLDFRDNASGQFLFAAATALQAGATSSTFFENQVNAAVQANYGVANCQALVGSSCTTFIRANFATLVSRGDVSDLVSALYSNGLLRANVGVSGQFGTNIYISNQGSSSYNGLLISLRKRFSKGLQFDLNYTLSNAIDNQSSITNTVTGGLVCDLTNLRACRGPSDFDIRHLFNANFIYELPFGRGHYLGGNAPGWVNQIIGGWEVTGIVGARSGLPFSTTTGSFPVGFNFNSPAVGTGENGSALRGSVHDTTSGQIQFFSDPATALAALRFPRPGEIGNRNTFRGPTFWSADTAVLKKFKMPWSENQTLVFRWESYNAFNHNSFGLPNASITSSTFGQITTSSSIPREMQFAIRYEF